MPNTLPSGVLTPFTNNNRGYEDNGFSFVQSFTTGTTVTALNAYNYINNTAFNQPVVAIPSGLCNQTGEIVVADWAGTVASTGTLGSIVVSGNSGVTINGSATKSITAAYGSVHLYNSGTNDWRAI